MKTEIKNKIRGYLGGLLVLFAMGCSDDETESFLNDGVTIAATVTSTENVNLELPIGENDATIGGTFIVQVPNNNLDNLERVEVLVAFNDVVTNRMPNMSTTGTVVRTLNAQDISSNIAPSGRPQFDFEISWADLLTETGVSADLVDSDDEFVIIFRSVTNDAEFMDTLTSRLICRLPSDVNTLTLELEDSFGDGWNGASMDIIVDGESTNVTIEDGREGTFEITVPPGAELRLVYLSGAFDNENSFRLVAPDGEVLLDEGPRPPVGEQFIDFCVFFTQPCSSDIPPTPGTWVLTLMDSFADGWDGATIDVIVDGVSTNFTISGGVPSEDIEINVPEGTTSIMLNYNPGNFESEHSFTLVSPFMGGSTVIMTGPAPDPGMQVLDFCNF